MQAIGGHVGMRVYRTNGLIKKVAIHELKQGNDVYEHNIRALKNEADMLKLMSGTGYAPELIAVGEDWITQEDLGVPSEFPDDPEAFRRNILRMLAVIRAHGLRHGDLHGANVHMQGDRVRAIDWQEGHRLGDPAPQSTPFSDSNMLMRQVFGTYSKDGELDTPRVARRWLAVLGSLGAVGLGLPLQGKTLLDIGCFQGDFTAAAAAEGMRATGLDMGGFRSGEDSIEIAKSVWAGFEFGDLMFSKGRVQDSPHFRFDVVLFFSTWAYLVQQEGREWAIDLLRRIVQDAGVLFFETQIAGDGPGPKFLRNDRDTYDMLATVGRADSIIAIPVTNRPASRTVWRVERRS